MTLFISLLLSLLLLNGCQDAESGNKILSNCSSAKISYPLQTGQKTIYNYLDISQEKYFYDDGYTQYGTQRLFLPSSNNVVEDKVYGLTWQDDVAMSEENLTSAQEYCENLSLNNFGDWRLPNIYELMTLINIGASTNSRESAFKKMPYGAYYSSNELKQAGKVMMINFQRNDFNITLEPITMTQTSPYGVLIATKVDPSFNNDGYLVSVNETLIYQNDTNTTTVVTNKQYDIDSGLLVGENSFTSVQANDFFATPVVTPTQRYVKCVRGEALDLGHFTRDDNTQIVTDTQTGLMWQDDLDVVTKQVRWGQAIEYCQNLELGDYKDWRLPTITELASIVNYRQESDFVLHDAFRNSCACRYHSSSNTCYDLQTGTGTCEQGNYQLNTCGPLHQRTEMNTKIHENSYDLNNTEPYFRVRCVRCGSKGGY